MKIVGGTKKKLAASLLLTGLSVGVSCVPTAPTEAPPREKKRRQADAITVFITGNTLGELKPCGCFGGQLGGFDRRPAVFNTVPAEERLIMDAGSLVKGDAEQDLIKFNISIQAFSILGYNVVNLTAKDVEISENLGLLDEPVIGFISPHTTGETIGRRFQSQYVLKGVPITLCVVTHDLDASPVAQIKDVFGPVKPGHKQINILIVNRCDNGVVASVAAMGLVDCLVCPTESDEPMILSEPDRKPLAFSVGRYGRYVCKLQIRAARARDELKLSFDAVPVTEDLEQGVSMTSLYKDYQQLVREAGLLEKYPRYGLPGGLEYAGSKSCMPCHAYEYEKWNSKAHARAFATLARVGSNFDPECVVCHVVGMEYESGFVTQDKTGHLKDVGCENCHGPGSEHIRTRGTAQLTEPKSTCLDCHTPAHSGDYAGNERAFREKITHWREPNAAGNVK